MVINRLQPNVTTWINLTHLMLSKRNKMEKVIWYDSILKFQKTAKPKYTV